MNTCPGTEYHAIPERLKDTWAAQKFHGPKPGKQTGSRYYDDDRDMFSPLPAYLPTGGVTGPSGFAPGGRWSQIMPVPQPLPAYPAGQSPMLPNPDGDTAPESDSGDTGGGGGGGNGNTGDGQVVYSDDFVGPIPPGGIREKDLKSSGSGGGGSSQAENSAAVDALLTGEAESEGLTEEEMEAFAKEDMYESYMERAMKDGGESFEGTPHWLRNNFLFSSTDEGEPDTLGQAVMEAALPVGGKTLYEKNKEVIDEAVSKVDPSVAAGAAIIAGTAVNAATAVGAVLVGGAALGVGTGGALWMEAGQAIWGAGIRIGLIGGSGAGAAPIGTVDMSGKKAESHLQSHFKDWGITVTKSAGKYPFADALNKMKSIVNNIVQNRDEVRAGAFRSQESLTYFYRKGTDLVLTEARSGRFITILKDALNKAWWKDAQRIE